MHLLPVTSNPRFQWRFRRRDSSVPIQDEPEPDPEFLAPPPRGLFSDDRRVDSTVSIRTGRKLQQHLEAGNPLYLGLNADEITTPPKEEPGRSETTASHIGEDEEKTELSRVPTLSQRRKKSWTRFLTLGLPLNGAVKAIFTTGLFIAGYTLLEAVATFIELNSHIPRHRVYISTYQLAWALIFGAHNISGLLLLFTTSRYSPSFTLFFTICAVFNTLLTGITAGFMYYFFILARDIITSRCNSLTVSTNPQDPWDMTVPQKPAAPMFIEKCLDKAQTNTWQILLWAVVFTVWVYFAGITVVWANSYRRQLESLARWESEYSASETDEKERRAEDVTLVLGTAPLSRKPTTNIRPRDVIPQPTGSPMSPMPPTMMAGKLFIANPDREEEWQPESESARTSWRTVSIAESEVYETGVSLPVMLPDLAKSDETIARVL